ncbi:MAG: putative ribonuclease [Gammaproteobacteria bacterium]|nr:putative ribonuclease [Gammaproteobacteria bacterium]
MPAAAPSSGRTAPHRRFGDIVDIATRSVLGWFEHNASSLGAALAFYTLFSVAPILIIAVAIAGYVFGPDTAQTEVLSQLRALIGDAGAAAIRQLLSSAHYSDKKGLAAALGIITLVVGATSVFGELQNALERIWQTPPPPEETGWWRFIRARILSVGMVLGIGFLLLVSLVVSAALAAFGGWLGTFLPQLDIVLPLLDLVLSFGMTVLLFAMIYKYVPRDSVSWGDVWVGATVTAFLFTIGKSLIGLYLGKSSFNSAYGAAGSLIVLLLWIYYSAQIFLLGAEFTRVFAYRHGSRSGQERAVARDPA